MPLYDLLWTRKNPPIDGVAQDDSTCHTRVTATSPEKAITRTLEGEVFSPEELADTTLVWSELNEDGDVVRTSEGKTKK